MRPWFFLLTINLFVWVGSAGCNAISQDAKIATPEETSGPVEINIQNNSTVDFDRVVVSFPGQTEDYGTVRSGGQSANRTVEMAYRYAYVEVYAGEKQYVLQPIDYTGETLLASGRYTYSLALVDNELTLELIEQ